ncbi:MAG: hypothetical protein GY869_18895, partial [Planctomycetes bacterium]|nr:hypothetical protein [Planctomycetota bacterium]
MERSDLSASLEDYLEAIYLISADNNHAHANHIAEYLKVSKSSVSWALNQLSQKELINYVPYEAITLTSTGKSLGKKLASRHAQIKSFLTTVLGINDTIADANACRMEHVLDKEVFQRMQDFMTFLEKCPRAGSEWMKGFGYYCNHGQNRQNCPQCVAECLEHAGEVSESNMQLRDTEELPKLTKARDRETLRRLGEVLTEGGHPLTELHNAVIKEFMATEKHQAADDLYRRVRNRRGDVTRQIVDESLQILCEHKIARSLRFNEQTVYEHYHPESHHDHLFCVKCGAIVEFFDPRIEDLQIENARRADFRLLRHQLNIYGVCRDCIKQESKTRRLSECLAGETVMITNLLGDQQSQRRLADMGLKEGTLVQVLGDKCAGDNMIILVGSARLMVDRGTANSVKIITP